MKSKLILASLFLAAIVSPATIAGQPTGSRINPPSVAVPPGAVTTSDTGGENAAVRVMNVFARCAANQDPRNSQAMLELPYQSEQQSEAAAKLAQRSTRCLAVDGSQLRFSAPSLVGGVAEGLILLQHPALDPSTLVPVSETSIENAGLAPRNLAEDFAQCVAARDPKTVFSLITSELSSPAEAALVKALAPNLGPCLPENSTLTLTRRSVRSMLAVGVYRLMPLLASQSIATKAD